MPAWLGASRASPSRNARRCSTQRCTGPWLELRQAIEGPAARGHWELCGGGLLVARPPDESLDDVEPLVEQALRSARDDGVRGQAITPYVLSYLHRESGGRTLEANKALVAANAGLAAEIAVAYAG